jgi:hypothetical protein
VLGISKVINLKQFWNAPCSITFNLELVSTDRRLIQEQNACLPIVINDFGRITPVMSSRFLNEFVGIFLTPS